MGLQYRTLNLAACPIILDYLYSRFTNLSPHLQRRLDRVVEWILLSQWSHRCWCWLPSGASRNLWSGRRAALSWSDQSYHLSRRRRSSRRLPCWIAVMGQETSWSTHPTAFSESLSSTHRHSSRSCFWWMFCVTKCFHPHWTSWIPATFCRCLSLKISSLIIDSSFLLTYSKHLSFAVSLISASYSYLNCHLFVGSKLNHHLEAYYQQNCRPVADRYLIIISVSWSQAIMMLPQFLDSCQARPILSPAQCLLFNLIHDLSLISWDLNCGLAPDLTSAILDSHRQGSLNLKVSY